MAESWAEYDLNNKMMSDEEYANKCPICDMCKDQIVFEDYYYDIDDHVICPSCIDSFIENYRKAVHSYVESRR